MSRPASPLVLVVTPAINAKGLRASSVRGPLFDARLDGRLLVSRSTQPLFDACRALIAEGVDPATPIVMRHAGSDTDALRATVGAAAGLTIWDDTVGKPVFKPWQPYNGPSAVRVSAAVRQNEEAATRLAGSEESAPEAEAAAAE